MTKEKNKKKSLRSLVTTCFFILLLAGSFLFGKDSLAVPNNYTKNATSTLIAAEWNNLISDFVNTWKSTSMVGPLGIGTTNPLYPLNIQGTGGSTGFIGFNNSVNSSPAVGIGYDQIADGLAFKYNDGASGVGTTFTGPDGLTYGTVLAADGKIWLDRNLGATQVATSLNDTSAYGHLYQWGREMDGHQIPTGGNTATLSSTDSPGNNLFIKAPLTPYDWRSPQNNNLWQGVIGVNNPCPTGFRLPTQPEWAYLVTKEGITNYTTAYTSTLKLTAAGSRNGSNAGLSNQGSYGYYWSSTITGTNAYSLFFSSTAVNPASIYIRAYGFSVRCVKDDSYSLPAAGLNATGLFMNRSGNVGIGTTNPFDIFSIGTGGVSAPAGSSGTGHNNSMSYLSTDQYALVNYGTVKSIIASTTGLWGGTLNGNIWNGAAGAGNVGIGMTAPTYGLQVQGGPTRGTALFDTGTSTSETQVVIRARTGTNGGYTNAPFQIRNLSDSIVAYIRQDGVVAGQTIQTADNNSVAFMQPAGAPAAGLSGLRLNSTTAISWSSGPSWWNTTDTGITRLAAGKIAIGNATAGDYTGTLITGNLGIGTTNPVTKLQLNQTNDAGGFRIYGSTIPAAYGQFYINIAGSYVSDASHNMLFSALNPGYGVYFRSSTGGINFNDNNSNNILLAVGGGNVGIGTTAPNDTFSIGMGGISAPAGSSGTGHNNSMSYLTTDDYALVNYGTVKSIIASTTSNFFGGTIAGNIWSLNTSNIGIGTTTPLFKFDVNGTFRAASANISSLGSGVVMSDASGNLYATSTLPSGYATGVGVFVGPSTALVNGNNNGTPGYDVAYSYCETDYPNSHVCTPDEMLNSIRHGAIYPNDNVWIFSGPPGFTASANDCNGRQGAATTDLGAYWEGLTGKFPKGRGLLMACNQSLKIACCK